MDEDELQQLRQACLQSLNENKNKKHDQVVVSVARNNEKSTRSQPSQATNGLIRLNQPPQNSPLLPSPPVTAQNAVIQGKGNSSPYNGDFSPAKSQFNNGHRYNGSPGSPIRYHSQQPQPQQQPASAPLQQQPHHPPPAPPPPPTANRHHHIPPPPPPPPHHQAFAPSQNSFFRPNGGPPPHGHPPMNPVPPHMTGLPVPYGHQPPHPPHHPAYRSPYPHHPPPPGLPHLAPGPPFHPIPHAPSSFHPQAGYSPMHFAKRPSGPRHGFHNFYSNSFNHPINSGPNHLHSTNDHPPHLQPPPHLLPHGPRGPLGAPSNSKNAPNDPLHRSHFNEARNNSSNHPRKPFAGGGGCNSKGGINQNSNNNSNNSEMTNNGNADTSNQSKDQINGRCKSSPVRDGVNNKSEENESDSLKHRGPERFSRIERSDSESDEDDRLDGYFGDLHDEGDGDFGGGEKSQDSLYEFNGNNYSNPLLEDQDADEDESDKFDQPASESVEDEICKLNDSNDQGNNDDDLRQVKRVKFM